jgi:carbonic anhydrase/acetyltransferase-like protein (isoleucine patch superfamily)
MTIIPYQNHNPVIAEDAFIAPDAWVAGRVTVGKLSSVFFCSSIRGDVEEIIIGTGTNIQEHCILHTSLDAQSCVIGDYTTVGHRVTLHSCTVGSNSLIGMGATVLDGTRIGDNCIIGAHSLVTEDSEIPSGTLALGAPARVKRELTDKEIADIKDNAQFYIRIAGTYKSFLNSGKEACFISSTRDY